MKQYKTFIYGISFLALFAMSSQGMAGEVKILDPLSYPAKDVLKLNALDRIGLRGSGQCLGVVEFEVSKHQPDSLKEKIVNDPENTINADDAKGSHGMMVAQVAVSKYAGLAHDAKVFLASRKIKIGDTVLESLSDAIIFAIRNGADAINLSIQEIYKHEDSLYSESSNSREGETSSDILKGIAYALNSGIPVFTSAGNDKQEIDDKRFASIFERASSTKHPELLFIVGGFDYKSELFARKEISFAGYSGRAKSGNEYSRFFVMGPSKFKVEVFLSVEDRKKALRAFRLRYDAPKLVHIWTKDLQNVLEKNTPELVSKISPLLSQLEEQELYFVDAYKERNAQKEDEFRKILFELRNFQNFNDGIKLFEENVIKLMQELATGDAHLDAKEWDKVLGFGEQYDPSVAHGIFEERIMHVERDSNGRFTVPEIVFEEREVEGTSFASPAVASVYLRLNQYREQVNRKNNANLLTPEDIAVAMKATAYKKEAHDEGEEPDWYGCGVIDSEAAFKLCEKIVQARLTLSVESWMNIFDAIAPRYPLPAAYYFEILKAYKATGQYQRAEGGNRPALLRSFLEKVLAYYPTYYATHAQDRLEGALLYEQEKYEECNAKFDNILKEVIRSKKEIEDNSLDVAIFNKTRWISVLLESNRQMLLWFNGFLKCEMYGTRTYFSNNNPRYSITIRNGEKLLQNLLTNIEHGLTQYDSLHPADKIMFLRIAKNILGPNVMGSSVDNIGDLPKGMAQQIERLKEQVKKKR